MGVRGPFSVPHRGIFLPHEHVLVDFIGAGEASPARYEADAVFRAVLPHLQALRQTGGRALAECTPAYLGRDPVLLHRLAAAADLHLMTNTGYYGAGGDKYLPAHARHETPGELATRWTREAEEGIGATGIRPGFIKIATDNGPLTPLHRKLVRAAARTHRVSGLTIAMHTGSGHDAQGRARAGTEALAILREEGVRADAFIWVHAQAAAGAFEALGEAAAAGAWIEFDGLATPERVPGHLQLVQRMRTAGHLDRVLLSQDNGWYYVGEPGGGRFRPYPLLSGHFLPALRVAGYGEAVIDRLVRLQPAEALAVRRRLA